MIYFENITNQQRVLIPKEERASGGLHLILKSVGASKPVLDADVTDSGNYKRYYDVAVTLPSIVSKGEYTYILSTYGRAIGMGVAWVGEPKGSKVEYKKTSKIKQYE